MKDFFLCQMLFEGTLVEGKHASLVNNEMRKGSKFVKK